ncbi:hypothetical protein [Guggenheimella bovis]
MFKKVMTELKTNELKRYRIVCLLLLIAFSFTFVKYLGVREEQRVEEIAGEDWIVTICTFGFEDIKKNVRVKFKTIRSDGFEYINLDEKYGPDVDNTAYSGAHGSDGPDTLIFSGDVDGVPIKEFTYVTKRSEYVYLSFDLKEKNNEYYWERRIER